MVKPAQLEVVYHYTTMGTLLKIVESRQIWATSVDYLNDTSERKHFLGLIERRMPEYAKRHDLNAFLDPPFVLEPSTKDFLSRPFVASFSTESDSLSQWRSYCSQGNGVAIGFSVDCLKRVTLPARAQALQSVQTSFEAVQYLKDDTLGATIDNEITHILDAIQSLIQYMKLKRGSTSSEQDLFRLLIQQLASSKKHASFQHENEYRLIVSSPGIVHPGDIDFRPVRTTLIPYVPLGIPKMRQGHKEAEIATWPKSPLAGGHPRPYFIDRVVVGPTPNVDLSVQAVKALFAKEKMTVEIEPSNVPFRDW